MPESYWARKSPLSPTAPMGTLITPPSRELFVLKLLSEARTLLSRKEESRCPIWLHLEIIVALASLTLSTWVSTPRPLRTLSHLRAGVLLWVSIVEVPIVTGSSWRLVRVPCRRNRVIRLKTHRLSLMTRFADLRTGTNRLGQIMALLGPT